MEPEIGDVRLFGGTPYKYLGGPVQEKASWEEVKSAPAKEAPPKGSAVRDFGRMALQGLSFNFADDVLGDKERVEEIQERSPGAAAMAEVAGGLPWMMLPVGLAAKGVQKGAGLLSSAVRGAAPGAVEGGLFAAGSAEGSAAERAGPAATGAAVGAGVGALAGMGPALGNAALRRRPGRGTRVAEALEESSGAARNPNIVQDNLEAAKRRVSGALYRPLEQAHEAVDDPRLREFLDVPEIAEQMRALGPGGRAVAKGERAPSFTEIQRLRSRMRRVGKIDGRFQEPLQELDEILQDAVPGLRRADQEYAKVIGRREALEQGRKMANKPSHDIERAMRGMDDTQVNAFNTGRLAEIARSLERRESGSLRWFREFVDAGPETERVLRSLMPDDETYRDFRRVLGKEQSAERTAAQLKKYLPFLLAGAAGGAGFSLLGGGG